MPLSNRIEDLDAGLAAVYTEAKAAWLLANPGAPVRPRLGCTSRGNDVQAAYFAQGRQKLAEVNRLRRLAGLAALATEKENYKITDARPGKSAHNYDISRAFDVLFVNAKGAPVWEPIKWYLEFAGYMKAAARKLNIKIVWGYDWNGNGKNDQTFYDSPHYQMHNYKTTPGTRYVKP